MRRARWAGVLVAGLLLAGCGSDTTGDEIDVAGSSALTWGSGPYGVVLAHGASYDAASWEDQATAIADRDMTVVAVDDISPESIAAAVQGLKDDGIDRVALVGGSAGSDAILRLDAAQPGLADQLVLLSPNGVVEGLGTEPKLFIASEDEPRADVSTQLGESAAGTDNRVVLLPGSAHAQAMFAGDQADRVLRLVLDRLASRAR